MALYPEYRNIHCNCLSPLYGLMGDGLFAVYSITPTCHGGAPCLVSNYSGGNTWRPRPGPSLPVVPCTGSADVLLLATMTVTSHNPEGIAVEITDQEGTWLATYKNMAKWQPHCDLAMKLVDYETSYDCAIPWKPYTTLRPMPLFPSGCDLDLKENRGNYSIDISGVDNTDPNFEVVQALADISPITGTMWKDTHAQSFMVGDQVWVIHVRKGVIRLAFPGAVILTFRVTLHLAGDLSDVGSVHAWVSNAPTYESGGALAASEEPPLMDDPNDPIPCMSDISESGAASFAPVLGSGFTGAIDCTAAISVAFTTQLNFDDLLDCDPPGAGPDPPCEGESTWTLSRKPCAGGKYLYYWTFVDDECQGPCTWPKRCEGSFPFELSREALTDFEAEAAGYIDLLGVESTGGCDCEGTPDESPSCPCGGSSTWTLRRSLCEAFGSGQYLYYWELTSSTCGGGCDSNSCNPQVPYLLATDPVTEAQATALGYDDDLDQEIAGEECLCTAPYAAPECPEPPRGACCYCDEGGTDQTNCVNNVTEAECMALSGTFHEGLTCESFGTDLDEECTPCHESRCIGTGCVE